MEDGLRIERYGQVFILDSGEPPFGSAASVGVMALAVISLTAALTGGNIFAHGIFAALLFCFGSLFVIASHQWITEIDTATRRLKISRLSFGRWTKTIVDCALEECNTIGTIYYDGENASYGVYVQLKSEKRHGIQLKQSTFETASRVAARLATATRIPRLDIKS